MLDDVTLRRSPMGSLGERSRVSRVRDAYPYSNLL
jgi:hypothetical protein